MMNSIQSKDPLHELICNSKVIADINWEVPDLSGLVSATVPGTKLDYRLFHVTEISEGEPDGYRLAMANVISCLNATQCAAIYMLSGRPEGVNLYIGVTATNHATSVPDCASNFKSAFEGNFLGAKLEAVKEEQLPEFTQLIANSKHVGLVTGVPSFNSDKSRVEKTDFQSIERLTNSLIGENWQLTILAEPGSDAEISQVLKSIYDLSTQISVHIKQSVQTSQNKSRQVTDTEGATTNRTEGVTTTDTRGENRGTNSSKGTSSSRGDQSSSSGSNSSKGVSDGTSRSIANGTSRSDSSGTSYSKAVSESGGDSLAITGEHVNKQLAEMAKHLDETLKERFLQGRSKGMFRSAIYVSAENSAVFDRLSRGVLSIFQGNQATVTPLRIHKFAGLDCTSFAKLLQFRQIKANSKNLPAIVAHSIPYHPQNQTIAGATWLNTQELALLMGLPTTELPGIKIRKSVPFALNTGKIDKNKGELNLGSLVQHGRVLPSNTVDLPVAELNKHVFITGVTGSGKTTTCMKLLLESDLPFMVIEPAKTEYRALHDQSDREIAYYTLGREDLTPFRLNPFELVSAHENLAGHISTLNATLAAVFPMEAAMPYMVEEAIINAYKTKGWDIHSSKNFVVDDPWSIDSGAWPIFTDMIHELEAVIKSKGLGKEFEEKYQGSLIARLTNLTLGIKGRMLNTRSSLDFGQLLDKRVVIELEELKDEQDKALLMGLVLARIAECMKQRHRVQPGFQHLTLVEEAHRLLSRCEAGESGAKKIGVEMFANMLAEVRKYGEGLIIADQIPNKLVADVLKNTNTKIVHRLFAADDRNAIGDTMGLSDEQKDFLPTLQPGETIIFCGGWHAPVWVKIDPPINTGNPDIPESQFKAIARQQLWAQKQKLYPKLAKHPELDTPESFAEFSYQGTHLLNRFLRINHQLPTKSSQSESIRCGLVKELNQCSEQLQIGLDKLAELLSLLFMDVANFSGFSEADRKLCDEVVSATLPNAILCLYSSLKEFEQFIKSEESRDREVKTIFKDVKKLQAI